MPTLIHPTAVIHPSADLHPTVQVGAYAVIGERVKIGSETVIGAHAVVQGPAVIGCRNQIFPSAAIGLEPQDKKYNGALSLVKIGDDNCIREFVTINRATQASESTAIGNGNLLMAYVHVAHNCVIEDHVVISNTVGLAGHVHIESRAVLGGMAGVHQFVRIGKMAMVGGMSRITQDVPPFMLVEGYRARVRSINAIGMKRGGLTEEDCRLLKKAFRVLYRSGNPLNQALDELHQFPENEYLQHFLNFIKESLMPGRRGPTPGQRVRDEE